MMYGWEKTEDSIWKIGKRSVLQVIFSRTMLIMALIVIQFAYIIARMYAFAEHIPLILGSEMIAVAIMLLLIINSEKNPMIRLSWCFFVGVFPILGSVIYFVIHYDLGYRVIQNRILMMAKESRKYTTDQSKALMEVKEEDYQTYRMAQYLNQYSGNNMSQNSDVVYFPSGELLFEEMIKQLEAATEYIFLEYFLISPGKMWNTILEILERKAKAGVDIKILYDGSCSVYLLPYKYPEQIEKLGIQCKMFSPPIPFLSMHHNNRDHRKIMVIDGRVAFTGGINLCDEYININSPYGHWKDVGIMVNGDAVFEFTKIFMQMWCASVKKKNSDIMFPNMQKYFPTSKESENVFKGYVIPYADNPVDDENIGKMVYMDILNQAKNYVYIMTPYLILDNEMRSAILFAAKRGIDVQIILPHIPDKKSAFALAQENYKVLLEAGVKVYEYTPGFVHAKVFVADGERAVVGTINLDYRSLYWHYECAAYLYKVSAIKDIYSDFVKTRSQCKKITHETIKQKNILWRMFVRILKIVAPLM